MDADRAAVEAGLAAEAGVQVSARMTGEAGFFAGLEEASRLLESASAAVLDALTLDLMLPDDPPAPVAAPVEEPAVEPALPLAA